MHDYAPTAGFEAGRAIAEGWGLFTAMTDEAIITDLRQTPANTPFADEVAAREHVAARILAGSTYHAEAVRQLRRLDIEGYKVFREEHPACAGITDEDALF